VPNDEDILIEWGGVVFCSAAVTEYILEFALDKNNFIL